MKPTDSAAPASRLQRFAVPALPATILAAAGLALAAGAVDVLGLGAAALGLAFFGIAASVHHPWTPQDWDLAVLPEVLTAAGVYLVVSRALLWLTLAPRTGQLRTVARTAVARQVLVG